MANDEKVTENSSENRIWHEIDAETQARVVDIFLHMAYKYLTGLTTDVKTCMDPNQASDKTIAEGSMNAGETGPKA